MLIVDNTIFAAVLARTATCGISITEACFHHRTSLLTFERNERKRAVRKYKGEAGLAIEEATRRRTGSETERRSLRVFVRFNVCLKNACAWLWLASYYFRKKQPFVL